MITIEQIKEYATLKGCKVEEHFPNSYQIGGYIFTQGSLNKAYAKQSFTYEIGIELKKNVYYWWHGYLNENGYCDCLTFSHRYNCASGATQKSIMKGVRAELLINEILE